MAKNLTWDNVPTQLLQIIGAKIGSSNDFIRFSAVCKTWQSVTQSVMSEKREAEKALMMLSPESPFLLLAEEVQGTLLSCDIDNDEDEDGYEEDVDDEMEEIDDEEEEEDIEEEEEVEEEEEEEGEIKEEDEEDIEDEDGDKEEEIEEEEDEEEDYGDEDQEDSGDEGMEVDSEEGRNEDMEVDDEESGEEDMEVGQQLQSYQGFEDISSDDPYTYCLKRYNRLKISVGSVREIYSLSTEKLYTIQLPEAAGKFIMGTGKGWVLTIGKDFETNLLHPLLRQEISFPTTRVVRVGNEYNSYEGVFMRCVKKAAMSSQAQPSENVHGNGRPNITIMIIYGERGYLGFAGLGDEVWTKVDVPFEGAFIDIAYHRGKFYSVNCHGDTFVCHFDTDDQTNRRHATATLFARCPLIQSANRDFEEKYLVNSGSDLWLLVRLRQIKHFKPPYNLIRVKYRTIGFLVWKLQEDVAEDGLQTVHNWIPMRNLDNKAFLVGSSSSISLPSSGCISPNSIYFTDDARDLYFPEGGGHDMGVYNVESGSFSSHFQGKSLHPLSPPLWYT